MKKLHQQFNQAHQQWKTQAKHQLPIQNKHERQLHYAILKTLQKEGRPWTKNK